MKEVVVILVVTVESGRGSAIPLSTNCSSKLQCKLSIHIGCRSRKSEALPALPYCFAPFLSENLLACFQVTESNSPKCVFELAQVVQISLVWTYPNSIPIILTDIYPSSEYRFLFITPKIHINKHCRGIYVQQHRK